MESARRFLSFIAVHKEAPLPAQSDHFAALGLGGFRPAASLNVFTDDVGQSITDKNVHYSELTGWYWIWKNVSNVAIIGLCHYRRYFFLHPSHRDFPFPKFWTNPTPDNLAILTAPITADVVEEALTHATAIVPRRQNLNHSLARNYELCHSRDYWDVFIAAIRETCPELAGAVGLFDQTSELYCYNMMIARRPFFDDYMSKLFRVTDWMERAKAFPKEPYQCRVPAFVAERFFTFYLQATGVRVLEVPVVVLEPSGF